MLTAINRYDHAARECRFKAEHAQHPELSQLWLTIAASWSFLMQREERLAAEEQSATPSIKANNPTANAGHR